MDRRISANSRIRHEDNSEFSDAPCASGFRHVNPRSVPSSHPYGTFAGSGVGGSRGGPDTYGMHDRSRPAPPKISRSGPSIPRSSRHEFPSRDAGPTLVPDGRTNLNGYSPGILRNPGSRRASLAGPNLPLSPQSRALVSAGSRRRTPMPTDRDRDSMARYHGSHSRHPSPTGDSGRTLPVVHHHEHVHVHHHKHDERREKKSEMFIVRRL